MTRWPAIWRGVSLAISCACACSARSWAAVGTAAAPWTASAALRAAPAAFSGTRAGPSTTGGPVAEGLPGPDDEAAELVGLVAGPLPAQPATIETALAATAQAAEYQS